MKTNGHNEGHSITLAQLCEALANGHLPAQLEDDTYVIRSGDLRRYARASTPDLLFLLNKQTQSLARKAS
jgi:hypothetical protein